MKRTWWTAAAIGLLAACVTACGSDKYLLADLCNKLQSCGALSLRNVSTVSQCIANGRQQLSQFVQLNGGDISAADQATAIAAQAIEQCLTISDCPGFSNCVITLVNADLPP
jgi:hypothetical protein